MDGDYGPGDAPGSYGSDYGGSGDLAGAMGGGSFSDAGGGYSSPGDMDQAAANYNAALSGYGINEGIPGLGPSGIGPGKAALDTLSELGYGSYQGVNPNNPTQSVDEMRAAENVHNFLNYAAPAFASLVPGYGTVSALGKGIANIHGLMTGRLSAEEVVPGLVAGLVGARTGIPSGIVEGIITNDLGKAVGSGAQAGLGALVGGLTGSPFAGALASSTLGPAVGRAASEAVGGTKSGGLGGLFGGAGVPSTSSAPTGNTYGDTGINADAYSVLAAIEQAAQEPKQPEWSSQMTAGRYGPLMEYEFGA